MGNLILFPAQSPTYTPETPGVKDHLVWIPDPTGRPFPALWYYRRSPHTLLYFHGNSVDLGDIADEMCILCHYIDCNILAFEFPGYGLCHNLSVDPAVIDMWGRVAFDWLVQLGASPMSIVPFGRSIGTGPAAKLAARLRQQNCITTGGIVLHCPYLSVHKVVADYTALGTWVIGNYWDIEESLRAAAPTTPLLVIHGLNDETIAVSHGKQLYTDYQADAAIKECFFPEDSPHNAYRLIEDLGIPIKNFLETKALSRFSRPKALKVPTECRQVPSEYLEPSRRAAEAEQPVGTTLYDMTSRRTSFIHDTTSGELVASIRDLADVPSIRMKRGQEDKLQQVRADAIIATCDETWSSSEAPPLSTSDSSLFDFAGGTSKVLPPPASTQWKDLALFCSCCPRTAPAPEDDPSEILLS